MNVIKFRLGRDYIAEFEGEEIIATCIEIKESFYSGKEIVFQIDYQYYRCTVWDAYDSATSEYCENAELGDDLIIFASREKPLKPLPLTSKGFGKD